MPEGAARRAQNVIDLAGWRAARRSEPVPEAVRAEMEAAARVYDVLLAQGHELRLELCENGSRVRAELRSVDGDVGRSVGLTEVVTIGDLSHAGPAA